MEKLYDWRYENKVTDTLVLSRLANTNRILHPRCPKSVWDEHNQRMKQVGPHSLMNLGYYAGCLKGDFGEDAGWEYFTQEMLEYCEQDVVVNIKVYLRLLRELNGFTEQSIRLEMKVAKYLYMQQQNGWTFDIKGARTLAATLQREIDILETEVHKTFKPLPKEVKVIQPRAKTDGTLSSVGLKFLGNQYEDTIPVPEFEDKFMVGRVYLSGEFTRIEWPEFNLGSRLQIAQQLMKRGWEPTLRTEVTDTGGGGNVIVNEAVLDEIKDKYPEAKLLADYFMVSKRLAMVNGWVDAYDETTGRIHGYVNTLGAVTARMTHSSPNLAQVPASKTDKETGELIFGFDGAYGADCRALFTVPEGYVQVGCDAAGLELRCLAHYMEDDQYTDQILNGDIHTANMIAAGLGYRSQAKTFIC